MLFNSIPFAVFLPVVFALYWLVGPKRRGTQNLLLIVASYVFYGWWDWRFLFLIVISSLVDYTIGLGLGATDEQKRRKALLLASLIINLGFLAFFKYFNFFIDSFADLLHALGMNADLPTLRIILPVGISFYTFQTLSYSIDVYRRQIPVTRDPIAFFAFVSFFPQLVAGPIERAKDLLPQFTIDRVFDPVRARDGLRQMLWGFFKKMVVADAMAPHVQAIFSDVGHQDGVTLLLGVFFFAMQIYCDFSGYSDIAIGLARLFGFSLMRNFAYPYFSRDIGEFWRRWHISLSSWFRDYVYIPLGGSFCSRNRRIWNLVVTFTVSGFWHGANWTFIVWGALNGLYYIPLMLRGVHKNHTDIPAEGRLLPGPSEFAAMAGTFAIVLLAWVFFRAESLDHALSYITKAFCTPYAGLDYTIYMRPLITALVPLAWEWGQRSGQHGLNVPSYPLPLRWAVYMSIFVGILVFGQFGSHEFIYFQF
jgi:D-alanyl-lipoteichoic acid acyltransferase DltB (MBOAT superfamily)